MYVMMYVATLKQTQTKKYHLKSTGKLSMLYKFTFGFEKHIKQERKSPNSYILCNYSYHGQIHKLEKKRQPTQSNSQD